jgi:hypothetical protein
VKSIIIAAIVAALVSVTAATAASGLITGAQIKNGSIGLVDLSAGAKRALKGQRGPQGPAGVPGAQGIPGGFDPAKVTYQQGTNLSIAPNTGGNATVNCPTGAVAISGGWVVITGGVGEVWTSRSYGGGSWTISVWNHSDYTTAEVTPFAVCAAR